MAHRLALALTLAASATASLVAACEKPTPDPSAAASSATPAASSTSAATAVPAATTPDPVATAKAPAGRTSDSYPTKDGVLTVTPIHHATLLLQHAGKAIYLDPVATDASYDGLPKADYVFITDIHPDHMDPAGLAKVRQESTIVVAPSAVNAKMPANVVLDNGASHDFGTFEVDTVPMYNLKRGPDAGKLYHDKGRGDGYVFTFGAGSDAGAAAPHKTANATMDAGPLVSRVYVSGDTECTPEMKALKNIDIAFVCMNLPYTMPPDEAAACVNAFKPRVVYPFHYKGSDLKTFADDVKPGSGVEVKLRDWYAE
jgi:L-ascorbate metabolism protein UlaG (beta-lactamase superfamily)